MNRRGFFRSLLGLGAVVAGAPLLPKVAQSTPTLVPFVFTADSSYTFVDSGLYWDNSNTQAFKISYSDSSAIYDTINVDQAITTASEAFGVDPKHFHVSDGRIF